MKCLNRVNPSDYQGHQQQSSTTSALAVECANTGNQSVLKLDALAIMADSELWGCLFEFVCASGILS